LININKTLNKMKKNTKQVSIEKISEK